MVYWFVAWEINVPLEHKARLGYIGDKVFRGDLRLRMANGTITSLFFLNDDPKWQRIGEAYNYKITLVPTTEWKLTNHHKTYLSVQCDILCYCCASVPIAYQCLTTLVA